MNAIGQSGEEIASRFLESKGYRILGRNVRFSFGEIDIIAVEENTLVFCEVKTRRGRSYGQPFEAVTGSKQDRIRRLSMAYLTFCGSAEHFKNIRFDVISITLGDTRKLLHIKNAF